MGFEIEFENMDKSNFDEVVFVNKLKNSGIITSLSKRGYDRISFNGSTNILTIEDTLCEVVLKIDVLKGCYNKCELYTGQSRSIMYPEHYIITEIYDVITMMLRGN